MVTVITYGNGRMIIDPSSNNPVIVELPQSTRTTREDSSSDEGQLGGGYHPDCSHAVSSLAKQNSFWCGLRKISVRSGEGLCLGCLDYDAKVYVVPSSQSLPQGTKDLRAKLGESL